MRDAQGQFASVLETLTKNQRKINLYKLNYNKNGV